MIYHLFMIHLFIWKQKSIKTFSSQNFTLQGFFFSLFLSDQKMDVRSMKAFKDGEFDSVLDKGKVFIIFSCLKQI
jgi:hypothetical protein